MEDLDIKEKIKLRSHKEKISNLILMWGGGLFAILLIVSLIPMGLIPRKRSLTISNPDLSIFESLGVLPTLLMLFILTGALSLYLYNAFKFSKLKKDLVDLKKITLNVKVVDLIYKQGQGPQEIDLFFSPPYNKINKVGFVGETNFPKLYKNQDIELVLTKNAHYPLSIKPKNDIKDVIKLFTDLNKDKG